uniref:DUF7953 domain-containing protein n=1 Tax=Rhizophora mucronata TaxID=61149 RepID=A0A2P2J5P0_RHIMU
MSIWSLSNSRVSATFLISWIILSCIPGFVLSAVVTLDSIKIYKTHELFGTKPTVYFHCQGGNKTELPDVGKVNFTYSFKGEESWQPLTEFTSKKCKRCGFYEKDTFKSDDVFDEWEFCPSGFKGSDEKYRRIKEKEFDATFLCPQCASLVAGEGSNSTLGTHNGRKGMHLALVILIGALVSTIFVLMTVVIYKYWQKKKREQDQARFLKLFEDGDDIEDELGLGTV